MAKREKDPSLRIMMDGDMGVITDGIVFTLIIKGKMMPQMRCTRYNYELILELISRKQNGDEPDELDTKEGMQKLKEAVRKRMEEKAG